jgi:hypothetical protein
MSFIYVISPYSGTVEEMESRFSQVEGCVKVTKMDVELTDED